MSLQQLHQPRSAAPPNSRGAPALAHRPPVGQRKPAIEVRLWDRLKLSDHLPRWQDYVRARGPSPLSLDPGWLLALENGLGHTPYVLEARRGDRTEGLLFLADVRSLLFGRFLVSLPYLNYGGVLADDEETAGKLVDRAVELADRLDVRHLELRQEQPLLHAALGDSHTAKVNMRLDLPDAPGKLWTQLSAKVRNQVRKAQKNDLRVSWGALDALGDFHGVFSQNMRDLGTPSYGKRFFRAVLEQFAGRSEICIIRSGSKPVAAGLLMHGWGISEVPSASSLREYNATCANMLLYWHMLERSVERGQEAFDFGRSTRDSATFRFKKQWGAQPRDTAWQYYVRRGDPLDARRDSPRYQMLIRMWQKLPVALTRLLGPAIVRGIP